MEISKTVIIILVLIIIGFIYIYAFKKEQFEIPAPAAVIKTPLPILEPREVSPSGPNPPNARNPKALPNVASQVLPSDPMDETYGSQDIKDNLCYPERSFKPGLVNSGTKHILNSQVASNTMLDTIQPIQPFKPELIQNGGILDVIGADDTHSNNNYASF